MSEDDSYAQYLDAKRTVDDRALSTAVFERLAAAMADLDRPAPTCLEIGVGRGDMPCRLVAAEVFPPDTEVTYLAYDTRAALVAGLADAIAARAASMNGVAVVDHRSDRITVIDRDRDVDVTVKAQHRDAREALPTRSDLALVVGKSVMDLLDPAAVIPDVFAALADGGHAHFPLTFDGRTDLIPRHPDDRAILEAYHATMDRRVDGPGTSRAATETIESVLAAGGLISAIRPSDWIVRPVAGAYPAAEAEFLGHILDTIEEAIRTHPTVTPAADPGPWLDRRRADLANARLAYVAHQLDLLIGPTRG